MNSHDTMARLRAARPADVSPQQPPVLFSEIVSEPGDPRFAQSAGRNARQFGFKRPRVLAGGSLGLAGVAAGLVLALSGTAATAPAFAVTREANGTVLVTTSATQGVIAADRQLVAMGIQEQVNVTTAPGPATSSAPLACTSVAGPGSDYDTPSGYEAAKPSGPPVQVRLGADNTAVVPAGQTGAGTVHLASCVYYPYGAGTQLGNSGQAFLDAHSGQ